MAPPPDPHAGQGQLAVGGGQSHVGRRLGAGLVLTLLIIGCQLLWIGVPVGGLWLSAQLTDSFGWHMPVALMLVIPGMFAVSLALAWLNDLYLRIRQTPWRDDEDDRRRPADRGPLEPLMAVSFVIAFAALVSWFFFFAENPSGRFLG